MAALLMNIQFYMSIWFHSLGMTAGFVFDHIMFPIWATIFFMDLFLSGGVMVKDIQSLIQGNADDFSYTLRLKGSTFLCCPQRWQCRAT